MVIWELTCAHGRLTIIWRSDADITIRCEPERNSA